jgi:8-amino-7-oxononanoate synthase
MALMAETTKPMESTNDLRVSSTRELIHDQMVTWLRDEAAISVEQIDYDASIFELGIDSLGAATIGCELEKSLQKKINPEVLFELDTINELAEYLDSLRVEIAGTSSDSASRSGDSVTAESAADTPLAGESQSPSRLANPLDYYEPLNRRVNMAKEMGHYYFEPEISRHDGAWVEVDGKRMLMLASYEYLGLLGHSALNQAAVEGLGDFGTGHHGARLLAGTTSVHKQLEAKIASFMDAQDAVVFSSGFVANLASIAALVGPGDCVIGDRLNHASIVDGCRMSGAELLEFAHNDVDALAEAFVRADGRRSLVVVDAVFSMDGDIVNLPPMIELCKQHGALLMVDEAHSLGVLGDRGRGIQEYYDLDPDDIDIKMGTLSKTLAGTGGFVAGKEQLTTYLRHHARGYIFSGALPASYAKVSLAALNVLETEPDRVQQLWRNVRHYVAGLKKLGFDTGGSATPIVPVLTKNDPITLEMTRICREHGLLVIPVCYPAVPKDSPRLRTCISAIQTIDEIDFALEVLANAGRQTALIS